MVSRRQVEGWPASGDLGAQRGDWYNWQERLNQGEALLLSGVVVPEGEVSSGGARAEC